MSAPGNGQPSPIAAFPAAIVPTPAPITPPPMTTAPVATAPLHPPKDLNAAILAAALKFEDTSTKDGPGHGREACAWSLNIVLSRAGIPELGENPRYVPALLEALKAGRGQKVPPHEAKAGDLVIAYGEEHIGIGITDGCTKVLSNSSSQAKFNWKSTTNFDDIYGGSSTVYRLLR